MYVCMSDLGMCSESIADDVDENGRTVIHEEEEDAFDLDSLRDTPPTGSSSSGSGSAQKDYGRTLGTGRPKRMRRHSIAY